MRTLTLFLFLFLLALSSVSQVNPPQVYISGNMGPNGVFPLFNHGTITMTGPTYTMTPVETTASIIRVLSSVDLSTTGVVTAPSTVGGVTTMGFEYVFQNATTGGQAITIVGSSGNGVTIPNGDTVMVIFDGANYVQVGLPSAGGGGTGWGNIVPNPFTTIQQAISAGGGPTVVLSTSSDKTSFSNPTNMRVWNFKQNQFGADSLFFRDVSEWGVIDGAATNCNTTAASNAVTCGAAFTNAPAPAGDVGKLIYIAGAGAGTYGQITGTMTVASTAGLTPGTPNSYQPITFTDATDGCTSLDTMPYAHIQLDATGLPTGNVAFNNWLGKGCTHPPTTGTITTVGGTVTFTGGSIAHGDLISTIASVTGTNSIALATNATYTVGGAGTYYGTDAHDTFQSACNAVGTGGFTNGTLTFSGMALISHGIDCNFAGFHLLGRTQHGMSSALIYAGSTPNNMMNGNVRATGGSSASPSVPNAYVLNVAQGGAAKIERVHILGNSQAMPYALLASFGSVCYGGTTDCFAAPGSGNFINQMDVVDQVTFGAFWGDPIADLGTMRLQSAIFGAGFTGNNDFWTVDHVYAYGCDVCFDGVNDQATNWHFGTIQAEFDNVGFAATGAYVEMQDYYTEFNRVDLVQGSPIWPGAGANYFHIHTYGGESSAMALEAPLAVGAWNHAFSLQIDSAGLGGSQASYGRPDNLSDDLASFNYGSIVYGGFPRGQVNIPVSCEGGAGSYAGVDIDIYAAQSQINYVGGGCNPLFANFAAGGKLTIRDNRGATFSLMSIPPTPAFTANLLNPGPNKINVPTMLNYGWSQLQLGSMTVQSPAWAPPGVAGYGFNAGALGTTGSTTYNYDVTCTDSMGNETVVQPVNSVTGQQHFTITNGTSPLTGTNYNYIAIWPREGCPVYNLYGDNGVGGTIGYLTSLPIGAMGTYAALDAPNLAFFDTGQWTKTARVPPTVTQSGKLTADNITITTLLNAPSLATDPSGRIIAGLGGGGGGVVSPFVIPSIDGTQNLTITVPNTGGGNPVLSSSTGTINIANLFVTDLVGTGPSILQTDPLGNVGRLSTATLPWSSLGSPVAPATGALVNLNMGAGATVMNFNLAGTNTAADEGVGVVMQDLSATNPTVAAPPNTRHVLFLWSQQPNISPFEYQVATVPGNPSCQPTCNGFNADGATGNLVAIGNAAFIGGAGGMISSGNITSDSAMYSPVYNVCTAASPCITPATAPLGRAAGGEPLSSVHLHDFSITKPTNGQVPIFNSSLGVYVPGTVSTGGSGAPSGPASGDLGGSYPSPTVNGLLGRPLPTLTNGFLSYNTSSGNWVISGVLSANQINGASVPTTAALLASNNLGQLIAAGTRAGVGACAAGQYVTGTVNAAAPTCAHVQYSEISGAPSGGGGSTRWDQLLDPTAGANWDFGGNRYEITINRNAGQGAAGIKISDNNSGTFSVGPGMPFLFSLDSNTVNTMPFRVDTYNASVVPALAGGWWVNPTNGDFTSTYASKLVAPVQLLNPGSASGVGTPMANAASLGTNANGTIVPATTRSIPVNLLGNATNNADISFGIYPLWMDWDMSTGTTSPFVIADSSGAAQPGNGGWMLEISSKHANVSPLLITTQKNSPNVQQIMFTGDGDLQISKIKNAAALGTDANGNIVPKAGGAGGSTSWSAITDGTASNAFSTNGYPTYVYQDMSSGQSFLRLFDDTPNNPPSPPGGSMLYLETPNAAVDPLVVSTADATFRASGDGNVYLDSGAIADGNFIGKMRPYDPTSGVEIPNAPSLGTDANGNIIPKSGGAAGLLCNNVISGAGQTTAPVSLISCTPSVPLVVGGHYRIEAALRLVATATATASTVTINQGGVGGTVICPSGAGANPPAATLDGLLQCEFTVTSSTSAAVFQPVYVMSAQGGGNNFFRTAISSNNLTITTTGTPTIDVVASTIGANSTWTGNSLVIYRLY